MPEPEARKVGRVGPIYCTCCKKRLTGLPRWLELDQRTGKYHPAGTVPQEHSQGGFPFGPSCAHRAIKISAEFENRR